MMVEYGDIDPVEAGSISGTPDHVRDVEYSTVRPRHVEPDAPPDIQVDTTPALLAPYPAPRIAWTAPWLEVYVVM